MYRKIEQKIWSDSKFMSLSSLPPSGQSLWLYLLTGPHNNNIPGLFRAGKAAMCEELDWSDKAFAEAFQEVFHQGLAKADWKAKLVWIPNALKHNKPASPNVVKSWGTTWELMPECDLKVEVYESMRAHVQGLGESYVKAFDEVIAKPSWKPFAKPFGKPCRNQEQEQEQDKTLSLDEPNVPLPDQKKSKPKTSGYTPEFENFWKIALAEYKRAGDPPGNKSEAFSAWKKLSPDQDLILIMVKNLTDQATVRETANSSGKRVDPFKHLCRWIKGQAWEDIVIPRESFSGASGGIKPQPSRRTLQNLSH